MHKFNIMAAPSIEDQIYQLRKSPPQPVREVFVYSKGACVWHGDSIKSIPYKFRDLPREVVENEELYRVALREHQMKIESLYKEAYDNFAEFMGWQDIDPAIVSWIKYKCWEDGHSSGYQEVMNRAQDYETLIDLL